MQINQDDWRVLVNEAAYSLIRAQAPDELPIYVTTRDRYLADPAGFAAREATIDRPLGMGSVQLLQTFTHTVFPLLGPVLASLTAAVAAALQQAAADQVVAAVRKLFAQPEPIFTSAQLVAIAAEISAIADAQQQQLQLDPAQVQAFKYVLIGRLALAKKA